VQQNHERRARSSRRRALTRKEQIAERWCHRGLPLARDGDKLVIALRKEEAGVLVMELSEHLWPEDLDLAISRCMMLPVPDRIRFYYLLK
jgi:hypothetical protein